MKKTFGPDIFIDKQISHLHKRKIQNYINSRGAL